MVSKDSIRSRRFASPTPPPSRKTHRSKFSAASTPIGRGGASTSSPPRSPSSTSTARIGRATGGGIGAGSGSLPRRSKRSCRPRSCLPRLPAEQLHRRLRRRAGRATNAVGPCQRDGEQDDPDTTARTSRHDLLPRRIIPARGPAFAGNPDGAPPRISRRCPSRGRAAAVRGRDGCVSRSKDVAGPADEGNDRFRLHPADRRMARPPLPNLTKPIGGPERNRFFRHRLENVVRRAMRLESPPTPSSSSCGPRRPFLASIQVKESITVEDYLTEPREVVGAVERL